MSFDDRFNERVVGGSIAPWTPTQGNASIALGPDAQPALKLDFTAYNGGYVERDATTVDGDEATVEFYIMPDGSLSGTEYEAYIEVGLTRIAVGTLRSSASVDANAYTTGVFYAQPLAVGARVTVLLDRLDVDTMRYRVFDSNNALIATENIEYAGDPTGPVRFGGPAEGIADPYGTVYLRRFAVGAPPVAPRVNEEAPAIYAGLAPQYQVGNKGLRDVVWHLAFEASWKIQDVRDRIKLEALRRRYNAQTAPLNVLPAIFRVRNWLVGNPGSLPEYTQRRILAKHPEWCRKHPQPGVIEDIVKTYTERNASETGVTVQVRARYQPFGGWRVGHGRSGKFRIQSQHSRDEIVVRVLSLGSRTWADVEDLVRGVIRDTVPPYMTVRIIPL